MLNSASFFFKRLTLEFFYTSEVQVVLFLVNLMYDLFWRANFCSCVIYFTSFVALCMAKFPANLSLIWTYPSFSQFLSWKIRTTRFSVYSNIGSNFRHLSHDSVHLRRLKNTYSLSQDVEEDTLLDDDCTAPLSADERKVIWSVLSCGITGAFWL